MSTAAPASGRSQAEQTAYGPMVIAAIEQHFPPESRLLDDAMAVKMLPAPYRALVGACRWGGLRNWLIAASETKAPGMWASMCGRKRFFDEHLDREIDRGHQAVIVLGAGFDSRGARLASRSRSVSVYELDLPGNSAAKTRRLRAHLGEVPERLRLIAVDFETADLGAALEDRGFGLHRPAVYLWEGVTQYLSEDGFRQTMSFLARAAAGSVLMFTYVQRPFIDGSDLYGSPSLHRDLVVRRKAWHFGLERDSVASLLAEYGWKEREQAGAVELAERYVAPTGRRLQLSEIERSVLADRR